MTPKAIDEEGLWVLYSFWWDDNFIKWEFNEVGVERNKAASKDEIKKVFIKKFIS